MGLFKKIKKGIKKGARKTAKGINKADRAANKRISKVAKGVGKGVSKAAKRVAKTRVTTNVSKGPLTDVFKFVKKVARGGSKANPYQKATPKIPKAPKKQATRAKSKPIVKRQRGRGFRKR